MIILIDPGHGGSDPGAVGNGLREKDINLSVCLDLVPMLKARGIDAILTRATDVGISLRARTDLALSRKAKAVISVHHNSGNGRGIETYRSVFNAGSKKMAELLHAELVKVFPELPNRGIKTRLYPKRTDWDYYHMIREPHRQAGIPSIITEAGFIDNAVDAAIMKRADFVRRQAEALAAGIFRFFGVETGNEACRQELERVKAELGIARGKIADIGQILNR